MPRNANDARALLHKEEAPSADASTKRQDAEVKLFPENYDFIMDPSNSIPTRDLTKEQLSHRRLQQDEHYNYKYPTKTSMDRVQELVTELSLVDVPSIAFCRQFSKSLSAEIHEDWSALNIILTHHENLIRARWSKASRTQKVAMLKAVWPQISTRHRPDMERGSATDEATVNTAKWPYLNLEDLVRPNTLLMFLNTRGHNLPGCFAYSDLELAPQYKLPTRILACRKDNCSMQFIGKNSASEYGAIIEWPDASLSKASTDSGRTVHLDHGMQILQIQSQIWWFLLGCVREILKDVDNHILYNAEVQPEPAMLIDQDSSPTSIEFIARNAPYCLPSRLDLYRLTILIGAKKRQAIDHVIALREDPTYFAGMTEAYREHRLELIPDEFGGSHEHARDFPLYSKVQRHLAADAHSYVFVWDHIHQNIIRLQELLTRHNHEITAERDLPKNLFDLLSETRHFIEIICLDALDMIKKDVYASPPLRSFHARGVNSLLGQRLFSVLSRTSNAIEDQKVMRVLRILRLLATRGTRDFFTTHVVLDEFERLMQAEPETKELITPLTAAHISELSILTECLQTFHNFQPWARAIENNIAKNRIIFGLRRDQLMSMWGAINATYQKFETPYLYQVGTPKDGKFYYPSDERRTPATVKAMIQAEAALDRFWNAANAHWRRTIGTTPAALVQHIIGDRVLHRTPPWVEPPRRPVLKPTKPVLRDSPSIPLAFAHDVSAQIIGSFNESAIRSQNKTKPKTRGAVIMTEDVENLQNEAVVPTTTTTLAVDKRALKTLKTLFHSPNSPDQPGQVAWRDFLHAMLSTGFAAEKLQGSAWHFTPKDMSANRSIQFHEPHPVNNLPFTWARRCGRRLNRAFGWDAQSFKLA